MSFVLSCVLLVSQGAPVRAAEGVLQRVLGEPARNFELRIVAKGDNPSDRFVVEAKDGTVRIEGTSQIALCRGAYTYLREACDQQFTWSGWEVKLPSALPDFKRTEGSTPAQYRHYFNVCTFGYTTAWWDWKRWQREIDWMALHGINMPLAMNGQESVWREVFASFGVPKASIDKHFSGPAFLPWHRMGNLNSHMGPLPESWHRVQEALQKQILRREREMGMTPVVPGFSGFVPVDFDKSVPGAKLDSPSPWCDFPATRFVDVRSPLFVEIGKRFVQAYRAKYGSDHLYLCDTFNEQNPQFPAATKLQDLAACGQAVYESLKQADPDAVWVMQGWLFYNARDYWKQPEVDALLSRVPTDKLIVLDLATSEYPVYQKQPAVRNAGWILNTLHNYGQNTAVQGPLQRYADTVAEAIASPMKGRMLGMGLTMEGIDQNPVVYELMTDLMWTERPVEVRRWIGGYVRSRYGRSDDDALRAWQGLLDTVYGAEGSWYKAVWRGRPSLSPRPSLDPAKLRPAVLGLWQAAQRGANERLKRDLVDVAKTWLGSLADLQAAGSVYAFDSNRTKAMECRRTFMAMLDDLDALMATRPEHRLSTWLAAARSNGTSPEERAHLERNARMQVTVWGGGDYLADYANKEWAGLNRDFLAGRWHLLFDALDRAGSVASAQSPNFRAWELKWVDRTERPLESRPSDPVLLVGKLLERNKDAPTKLDQVVGLTGDRGIAVGCKATDDGGTEAGGDAKWVTDGDTLGGYWAAGPAPRAVTIDLGALREVSGVRLFPWFGDGRVYTYRVETSTDLRDWVMRADGSRNKESIGLLGKEHRWPAAAARYVRVTMLSNSANPSVHLHEVRVLGQ